jgi:hypothetical protein
MNRKGVVYDVGRTYALGSTLRPTFGPAIARRELEIIGQDLHCSAVRICGRDIGRLVAAAEIALRLGLEVWLSPDLFERSAKQTLAYLAEAAAAAERLRARWQERMVFSVGSESTLFMRGIVPGRSLAKRLANPSFRNDVMAGRHNWPLNAFLTRACEMVRPLFNGPLTYASLIWEAVDWSSFDFVGVDHFRDARIKDRYVEMLEPLFAFGKPVVVTEFGMRAYRGADGSGTLGFGVADPRTQFLHQLPLVGRFVRPRLKGAYIRDETLQAREVTETLRILDEAGVDGAFVCTFVEPSSTFSEDPRHDLDMSALSLVKSFENEHGATYPDMPWEPKEAFRAVAAFYAPSAPRSRRSAP